MVLFFLELMLAIALCNICSVNSAGVPNVNSFTKLPLLKENDIVPTKTPLQYLNNFDYKFESLNQIINKMDNSLQNLQEKTHSWVIFQHHINSWNDGIRILENKVDLLKRNQDDQQQQFERLEITINNKFNARFELLLEDIKKFFISERKSRNEISSKINNILKYIQLASVSSNEKKSNKKDSIITPVGVSPLLQQRLCANITNKIEQRFNNMSHQMALQKEQLKQFNFLEKKNSKSLENMKQVLSNQIDKCDEITTSFQKCDECCHSVASELTTFTESSDILLKRIEKLVRSISDRFNDIEVAANDDENINVQEQSEIEETLSDESLIGTVEHSVHAINVDKNITENFECDDNTDVEFLRPLLNGCHELLEHITDVDADTLCIDGTYKFSNPNISEAGRDFNERYCVFAKDSGSPWTVIQRRGPYLQQENFNRSWSEYRNGFGHLSKDFWFGNEFIHRLVYYDDYELRIELEDFDGTQKWAEYGVFRVDCEKYHYNLLIGEYRGTISDAMKYHNDNDFSTYDKRNDKTLDACCSCAVGYGSGWWFDNCSEANLNGIYHFTPLGHNYVGIMWELWQGDYSLKKTRMMIRPRNRSKVVQGYHDYIEDP